MNPEQSPQESSKFEAYMKENGDHFESLIPPITEPELHELCGNDEELRSLLTDMLNYAQRYAVDVWKMSESLTDQDQEGWAEEYARMDEARTRLHNALIDSIHIFGRALRKKERSIEWITDLTANGKLDRSACGRFALLLVYRRYLDQGGSYEHEK